MHTLTVTIEEKTCGYMVRFVLAEQQNVVGESQPRNVEKEFENDRHHCSE